MLDEILERVDGVMEGLVGRRQSMGLYRMMAYHLGWIDDRSRDLPSADRARYGGKKMRALLCALACEAAGGQWADAIPAASAVELIQNFSLVHDDIEDGDRERRHRPTVWVLWGIPHAINTGSAMQALVNAAILDTQAPPEVVRDVMRALTEAMIEMTEGQYLDIAFQGRDDVTVEEYTDMASRKTGALMEAAAFTGARLATDDEDVLGAWRRFGRSFGQAFQARDDLLGVIGDPAVTGKPVGNDVRVRKKAMPLVYAWNHAASEDQAILREALREDPVTDDAVTRVTAILQRSGALDATHKAVGDASRDALLALEAAGARGPAAARIREMVSRAVGREQ